MAEFNRRQITDADTSVIASFTDVSVSSQPESTPADAPVSPLPISTLVPFNTVITAQHTSGEVWSTQINATVTAPVVVAVDFVTTLNSSLNPGLLLYGFGNVTVPLTAQSTSISIPSNSSGTTNITDTSLPSSKPSGLSPGAAAGVAIAGLVAGALIASAVLIALQRRKQRKQDRKHVSEVGAWAGANRYDEKSRGGASGAPASTNDSYDLDRLLPQPLDDSRVKAEIQTLFTEIDGHVENFYSDVRLSSKTQVSGDHTENGMLLDPTTRLFAIKKLVCQTMLDAINPSTSADHSLLPCRFGSLARQLVNPNVDIPANALAWSRLRSSFGYLLKTDQGSTERGRIDQSVNTIVEHLNARIQPFELSGVARNRRDDLGGICRTSERVGRMLLSQPAAWKFEWQAGPNDVAGSRRQLVYFPSLVRLTDNKAQKLRAPFVALPAKTAAF